MKLYSLILLVLMFCGPVFAFEEVVAAEVASAGTESAREVASTPSHSLTPTSLFWWSFVVVFVPGLVSLFVIHRDRFISKNF